MLNRRWRLALGAMCASGMMCVSGVVWVGGASAQTHYTDTQTTDLNNGDTVTTTANGTFGPPAHGFAVFADDKTITLPGNNTLTTSDTGGAGIFVRRSLAGSDATVNATGTVITTTGNAAWGVRVLNEDTTGTASATLNNVTITTSNAYFGAIRADAGNGGNVALSITGSSITSNNGPGIRFFSSGSGVAAIIDTAVTATGVGISAIDSIVTISGTSKVTTTGDDFATGISIGAANVTVGNGVIVETRGSRSDGIGLIGDNAPGSVLTAGAATVTTHGDASAALIVSGFDGGGLRQSTATLTDTVFTTTGQNAAAFFLEERNGTTNIITANGVTLTTGNAGSHGVVFTGSKTGTNQVTFDAASKITTNGPGAHGVSVQHGATQTLDVAANAGPGVLVLPSTGSNISIQGAGSALVQAQDDGSVLTIEGNGLPAGVSFGADAWGVIAENGGTVSFTDFATTQGYSLWARGTTGTGTIAIGGGTTTVNSRVRVDAGGLLDISGTALGALIASLEGNGGKVNLGDKSLAIQWRHHHHLCRRHRGDRLFRPAGHRHHHSDGRQHLYRRNDHPPRRDAAVGRRRDHRQHRRQREQHWRHTGLQPLQ